MTIKKAILCADLHIRDDQPECRLDDFEETLWKKFKFLKDLQKEYNCPIFCAGDIFHRWKETPWLINKCIERLPDNIWTIAGNHDLPNKNIQLVEKSALWTLVKSGKIKFVDSSYYDWDGSLNMYGFSYGMNLINSKAKKHEIYIALIHRLITDDKSKEWRGSSATDAKKLLKNLKGYDLIVTGDNHKSFTVKIGDTLLVNPGSFTRQTAAQMEHEPCVYLWDVESNTAEKIILPHNKKSISRKHIEKEKERNQRLDGFVTNLNDNYEIELSLQKTTENYFEENKENEQTIQFVWESIGG